MLHLDSDKVKVEPITKNGPSTLADTGRKDSVTADNIAKESISP